ncbi:MAG: hypothetical protein B6244_09470 [Candidatus Cloacimonetes bacterium 4572_55]|nr:MAG: hypothetical protein B6244_09470 [Candidatus Cloacimonetes bacterium 4572_55]
MKHRKGQLEMVITDLDGTLLPIDGSVSSTDFRTLQRLGEWGVCRVIATGRSLFSAKKVLPDDFPIDYLIFSSGSGILDWHEKKLLFSKNLTEEETARIAHILIMEETDFMLHKPIPENHRFLYYKTGADNPDFGRRCAFYQDFISPLESEFGIWKTGVGCQFVAIIPQNLSKFESIKNRLGDYQVIRATSPLDGKSIWIEVLPKRVSKGSSADRLCRMLGKDPARTVAIGNDYNDVDLLDWAGMGVMVENAPEELKRNFYVTSHTERSGFTGAVFFAENRKDWL